MKFRPRRRTETIRALRQEVDELRAGQANPPTRSRRGLLLAAGAAAVGAAGSAKPASAANGAPLLLGQKNESSQSTELYMSTGDNIKHHLFVVQDAWPDLDATFANATGEKRRAAIMGWSASWVNDGVAGIASTVGGYGGYFHGEYVDATGLFAEGRRATMRLGAMQGTPTDDFVTRVPGEIVYDTAGDLWFCVVGGQPGDWRKLTGPSSAGSFHAISPARVYDSRSIGELAINQSRLVSVANMVDNQGATLVPNVVPVGAAAIAYNLTITGAVGGGFLSINEGGNASSSTSAINWTASGATIANASIVKVNGSRQVTVVCGGGSTHFIIDVVGYFR